MGTAGEAARGYGVSEPSTVRWGERCRPNGQRRADRGDQDAHRARVWLDCYERSREPER